MKLGLIFVISLVASPLFLHSDVGAQQSLRMQPLEYRTTLATGEVKKAHVDITNPGDSVMSVTMSVRAFRQIDDTGTLQFYEDEAVNAGITLDYTEFELAPRETVRLYFSANGSKLPTGDVFAAIFATGVPAGAAGGMVQPSVRIGMLLSMQNGTPGSREARVSYLQMPFLQLGNRVEGQYVIQNTASEGQATGFYPTVTIALTPIVSEYTVTSNLVFAGRSRTSDFAIVDSRFGLYKVSASYGNSQQSGWVFLVTGFWPKLVAGGLITSVILLIIVVLWRKNTRGKRKS